MTEPSHRLCRATALHYPLRATYLLAIRGCLGAFVGFRLRSCLLHSRMNGGHTPSMAVSSTAEDPLSDLTRSSSVLFTALMGIDLRGPYWVALSSKVLDRAMVVVHKRSDPKGTRA